MRTFVKVIIFLVIDNQIITGIIHLIEMLKWTMDLRVNRT